MTPYETLYLDCGLLQFLLPRLLVYKQEPPDGFAGWVQRKLYNPIAKWPETGKVIQTLSKHASGCL